MLRASRAGRANRATGALLLLAGLVGLASLAAGGPQVGPVAGPDARPNATIDERSLAADERQLAADERDGVRPATAPELAQEGARAAESREAAHRALERGLLYLAERQRESPDGSFPRGPAGETQEWAPVGVTALAALAFLADGSSPGRGPFGQEVARAIDYLLGKADLAPSSPTFGYVSAQGDRRSRTHGHGFATLALAEAYGMAPDSERLKRALVAAVGLIEASQGAEGGWEYEPVRSPKHEGSVTICYVQALRAARNAGIEIDRDVIARAEGYVLRLQKDDGTFRYGLNEHRSSVALTAAGISTLNAAGRYDSLAIQRGIDAIWSRLSDPARDDRAFPYYERLYLAQAFWQLSDPRHFERWYEPELQRMLERQEPDGSWTDPQHGSCYATAMNCLVLAIPQGVLPIFQR